MLRGMNVGAFGLMYTAVYRIFGVGYVGARFQAGKSLADDSWWVIITATSYVWGEVFWGECAGGDCAWGGVGVVEVYLGVGLTVPSTAAGCLTVTFIGSSFIHCTPLFVSVKQV